MANFQDTVKQSDAVFMGFAMETASREENEELRNSIKKTIDVDEIDAIYVAVGQNLVEISNKVYEEHKERFKLMAEILSLTSDSVVTQFMNLVNQIETNHLGTIVTLFSFGYYLIKYYAEKATFNNILKVIRDCILKFVGIRLARWIDEQGGWLAVVNARSTKKLLIYACVAIVLAFGFYKFRNRIH